VSRGDRIAPKSLEQWYTTIDPPDPYEAPEVVTPRLVGLCDGDKIITSRIASAKGRRIMTENGSVYILGTAERGFLSHLRRNGYPFDPENPIKLVTKRRTDLDRPSRVKRRR
jgi:hypothetical protein